MWKIKKSLLEDAFMAAENYLPDEFMCFLGGNKKEKRIDEIVLLPTYNGKNFSSINLNVIPIDDTIVGSLHSHPNGNAWASRADSGFFKRFEVNIILGMGRNRIFRVYGKDSSEIKIEIVD